MKKEDKYYTRKLKLFTQETEIKILPGDFADSKIDIIQEDIRMIQNFCEKANSICWFLETELVDTNFIAVKLVPSKTTSYVQYPDIILLYKDLNRFFVRNVRYGDKTYIPGVTVKDVIRRGEGKITIREVFNNSPLPLAEALSNEEVNFVYGSKNPRRKIFCIPAEDIFFIVGGHHRMGNYYEVYYSLEDFLATDSSGDILDEPGMLFKILTSKKEGRKLRVYNDYLDCIGVTRLRVKEKGENYYVSDGNNFLSSVATDSELHEAIMSANLGPMNINPDLSSVISSLPKKISDLSYLGENSFRVGGILVYYVPESLSYLLLDLVSGNNIEVFPKDTKSPTVISEEIVSRLEGRAGISEVLGLLDIPNLTWKVSGYTKLTLEMNNLIVPRRTFDIDIPSLISVLEYLRTYFRYSGKTDMDPELKILRDSVLIRIKSLGRNAIVIQDNIIVKTDGPDKVSAYLTVIDKFGNIERVFIPYLVEHIVESMYYTETGQL